ncbi:MAG: hypothetical protein ANABAC_2775 [Anaerolineae bacterium]|nr:MAG: hypothetical protein ANABAC_2775 [Anaerolineae bacterium]
MRGNLGFLASESSLINQSQKGCSPNLQKQKLDIAPKIPNQMSKIAYAGTE